MQQDNLNLIPVNQHIFWGVIFGEILFYRMFANSVNLQISQVFLYLNHLLFASHPRKNIVDIYSFNSSSIQNIIFTSGKDGYYDLPK